MSKIKAFLHIIKKLSINSYVFEVWTWTFHPSIRSNLYWVPARMFLGDTSVHRLWPFAWTFLLRFVNVPLAFSTVCDLFKTRKAQKRSVTVKVPKRYHSLSRYASKTKELQYLIDKFMVEPKSFCFLCFKWMKQN